MNLRKVQRRRIKVKFVDFFPGHVPEKDPLYKLLSQYYDIDIVDRPDYLIHGGLGNTHIFYDCIKITVIGENTSPDFNLFDYAIGFDYLQYADRFIRYPLFAYWPGYSSMEVRDKNCPRDEDLVNRKFCSFVVSNGRGDACREKFFRELSKYKKVDSGGRYLNNVGGPVRSKSEFCREYKFNIAFENSVVPGYVTEKIMEPLLVHSVPIYYGTEQVMNDFSDDCMVFVKGENDIDDAIERIIALDKDDAAYLKICKANALVHPIDWYEDRLVDFLLDIFERPIAYARRTSPYGAQLVYREQLRRLVRIERMLDRPAIKRLRNICHRICNI